ncbi:MAG: hypothetical protein JWQ71_3097 [Pedosphaera sp.]|nr:hypothetical protein [Pedosphaera sp.]
MNSLPFKKKFACLISHGFVGFLVTLIFLAAAQGIHAALLSYEGFNYPSGSNLVGQNGGTGFGANAWLLNSSGASISTNRPDSLSYTDASGNSLVTSGGSVFLQGLTTGNTASQPNRLLGYSRGTNSGGADGVTTWVSFLAVRRGLTTNSTIVPNNPYPRSANLSLYNSVSSNSEKLAMGNTSNTPSNTVALLPVGNIANIQTTTVSYSQTNLIVVRIDHNVGANDDAYLFVNPPLGSQPGIGLANASSLSSFDFSFNRIRPFAGGDQSANQQPFAELILDEIRIGETYEDVTPFIPKLSVAHIGSSLVLTWSGIFNLQSATNVTGPYVPVSGATSLYTNNLSAALQFFRLSN